MKSVTREQISCIDFRLDIGEVGGGAVGEDGLGETLELGEIVDHAAPEECGAVLKGRLVDYNRRAFGLDALHYALNRRLTEIVGV